MIKEALLNCSGKGITLSLDGEMLRGVVDIDNISNVYRKDTAKEVFPMAIWRDDTQYDLCPKCRKEFKRFMKNGA